MAGTVNLYSNLPGHLVEFKDGGMALRSEPIAETTSSVLLLGTAVDGPINEPVAIDMSTIESLFGKDSLDNGASNGTTLVRAAKQLHETGVRDIRVMRVTGSTAKAVISKRPSSVSAIEYAEETLGLADGNEAAEFTLTNKNIIEESVRVYANGVLLNGGYKFSAVEPKVTLEANACNAGANIQITYSFNKEETLTQEEFTIVRGMKIKLPFQPATAGSVTVEKNEGGTVEAHHITVRGAEVLFASEASLSVGDKVKVSYTGLSKDVHNATETGTHELPFIATTGTQEFEIAGAPLNGEVKIYADGVQLPEEAYSAAVKTIEISKEYVALGTVISASYAYSVSEAVTESITIESVYGGEVYNQGSVAIRPIKAVNGSQIAVEVVLTKPVSKRAQVGEAALVYKSTDYPTFGQLVDAINADPNNGLFKAYTDFDEALTKDLKVNVTATNANGDFLIGGTDGVNVTKAEMFEALSGKRDADGYVEVAGAYQLLEDYSVDWVMPLGVYADDKLPGRYQNFAYELALFCAVLSSRTKTTLGVIGMKPCADTSLAGVQAYAQHLASFNNQYPMLDSVGNIVLDGNGRPIDLGKFISVVGGPDAVFYTASLGRHYGPAAVAYLGLNMTIAPQAAPTNKPVNGVQGLRFRLSNKQHDDILGNRIVTLKLKNDNGAREGKVCPVDGVTAALPTSDYTRLSTAKVVRSVVDHIREVSEPYIGEPNTVEQRNALSAAISKRLGNLRQDGVIAGYDFLVQASQLDQVLGQCSIELSIVPPQELRKITTIVGLNA